MGAPADESKAAKPNRAYYDEFAPWYERQRHRGYHALLDELESGLVGPHAVGARVLDAGCGTGLILREVQPVAAKAVGADLSHGMLGAAAGRGLTVAQANLTALPFADASFDLVFSFKVLAHVQDIGLALRELTRVTRPGGRLLLEFYNPWSLRYLAKRLWAGRISESTTERAVYTRWDSVRGLQSHLPEELELLNVHGVRVLTPAAAFHRVPGLGSLLRAGERLALHSPLRYFGGFVVAECLRIPSAPSPSAS